MSQFPSKGPWGRNPGTQQVNPQIFTGQLGLSTNQFGMPQMSLGGLVNVGGNLMPVNAVQFQAQQNLGNALQFGVGSQLAQSRAAPQQQQPTPQQKTQRSFVGFVTKMVENYGFIDEEVFFQSSVVKGPLPRVGDRVMCEAAYNPNMAFKWNAVRVQLIPNQQDQPAPVEQHRPEERRWAPAANERRDRPPEVVSTRRKTPPRRSPPARRSPPVRRRSPSPKRPAPSSIGNGERAKRERPSRSPSRNTGDTQSRRSSRSPPARRAKVAGRHVANLPKMSLDKRHAGLPDLRRWFSQMYIPSDFIQSHFAWVPNFPLHRPLNLDHSVGYHILHKDVQRLGIVDDLNSPSSESFLDQPDCDYRFCAKVMLMSCMPMQEIYKKVLTLQEDGTLKSDSDVGNLNKEISFLVGVKGKNEVLAIGGPWSPSADGLDPINDPRVLIRTAIRTTKALTGIDLSKCTQWYKFLEVRYRRVDKEKKTAGGSGLEPPAAKVETVVVFVPDVWSVAPTTEEFEKSQERLRQRLDERLAELDRPKAAVEPVINTGSSEPTAEVSLTTGDISTEAEPMETGGIGDQQHLAKSEVQQLNCSKNDLGTREKTEESEKPEGSETQTVAGKGEPTHWSKLDFKTLKVVELRIELEARGLDAKGIKSQLVNRLQKAVTAEQEEEEKKQKAEEAEQTKEATEVKIESEPEATAEEKKTEEKKLTEKEEKELQRQKEKEEKELKLKKESLQRHYTLGKDPQLGLLVFPHTTAKSGRFDCKVVSLQSLLDYRVEDNKEHSFEVALFAEMFQNMLVRDFAFKIYKSLLSAPDLVAEEKKKEEEKRQKEEEEKRRKELERQQKEEQKKREEEQKAAAEAAKLNGENTDGQDVKIESAEPEEQEEDLMDTTELQVKDEVKEDTEVDQAVKDTIKPAETTGTIGKSPADPKKTTSVTGRSKSNDREKEKRTSFVEKPDLLLAYSFFDQNGSGVLVDKDAEEILSNLGLHLSRAQITRLLKKQIIHGDSLHYRKLTDSTKYKDKTTGEEVKLPLPALPIPSDEEIAVGNNPFLLIDTTAATESSGGKSQQQSASIPDVTANASVIFQGAVVDLSQIFNQLRRMETEQKAVTLRSSNLEKDLKSTKETVEILEKRKRRLEDDLKDTKRKLNDTEKYLKNSKDDTVMLKTALGRCKASAESVIRQVERVIPSERKKEESASSSSSAAKKESKIEEPQSISVGNSADTTLADDEVQIVTPSSGAAANGATAVVSLPDGEQAESEELAVKDEIIVESDKAEADME